MQQQDRRSALHARITVRSAEAAGLRHLAIPTEQLIYTLLAITLGKICNVQKEDAGTGSRRLPNQAPALLLVGLRRQTQIRT